MNHPTSQEKMPLLFLDEQGRSVSFDNIHNMGVVPKNLIPQSKIQLINTLLHRLEKQNELLLIQRKTQSYLGGLSDGDELDELDELITVMVNEVDFSKLSTVAKDKLINSLLRRVKKHQKLISNITKRNLDERDRLKAVEMHGLPTEPKKSTKPKVTATDISESEVTDSFVELLSGSMSEPELTPNTFEVPQEKTRHQANDFSKSNEPFAAQHITSSSVASVVDKESEVETSDTAKYAEYFAKIDAQQEQRRQQNETRLNVDFSEQNKVQESINEVHATNKITTTSDVAETAYTSAKIASDFPHYAQVDEEDDEADDEDEAQYLFDLKDSYQDPQALSREERTDIEVVMLRQGEVVNVDYVTTGQTYRTMVAGKKYKLIKNGTADNFTFFYDSKLFKGQLLEERTAQPTLLANSVNIEKRQLPNNGVIRLEVGNVTYLLRRVAPITSPTVVVEKTSNKPLYQSLFGSAVFHFIVLLMGSLLVTLQLNTDSDPEPQFVSVDIKDLQPKVEPPKPPEPKVVKPIAKPKPKPIAKAKPKKVTKAVNKPKQVTKKVNNEKPASTVKVNVKKTGLLASLGSPKSKKSSSKQALAKVTNLNAVSSLNSQSAKTKVGGISAKVANSRVSIPNGPALDAQGTMVSGEGRNNIAALNRGDVASGDIRGKVTANLTKKAKIGGGLSREAVKKVIDANMAEVTYCYEKALVGNANLSGKAVFEWKILQNGSVGQVGIQSSTLRSNKLHSCIKGAIKSWQFPQPKGVSSTTVSYPFIFNMVGF